jgi:hypothetical protein
MDVKEAIETLTRATADCSKGDKHIVVLDRGWIFAGDLSQDDAGIYTLTNAVNIRKWSQGGFGALSKSAKEAGATLDGCAPIRFHRSALIFAVPISGGWDA